MLEEIEETTKSGNRFLAAFDGVKSEAVTLQRQSIKHFEKTILNPHISGPLAQPHYMKGLIRKVRWGGVYSLSLLTSHMYVAETGAGMNLTPEISDTRGSGGWRMEDSGGDNLRDEL